MVGAEVADWNNIPAAELTDAILEQMKDAGYLLGKTGPGRNVLTFMPPLIIAESDIDEAPEQRINQARSVNFHNLGLALKLWDQILIDGVDGDVHNGIGSTETTEK